jgi:hypothetical protein
MSAAQTAAAAFHGSQTTGRTSTNALGGCVERWFAGQSIPTLANASVSSG